MSKQIKVSDELYEALSTRARGEYRTIGGVIDWALANSVNAETKKVPEKISETPVFRQDKPGRTISEVLGDINLLKAESEEAAANCQDQATINSMKRDFDDKNAALWAEYNRLKAV
jgi:hypothetical protein